jgi:quercetin dioxygenase-like cupin family protein
MDDNPDHDPSKIVHVPPGGGHKFWVFGDLDIIKAASADTGGEMTFVETVVPPRSGPPLHIHERESESIYVLEGEVRVRANGLDFVLPQGGFTYMPANSVHLFENTLDTPSRILLIFLPAGIEGYFEALGVPQQEGVPSPGGAVDFDLLDRVAPQYGIEIAERTSPGSQP